MSRDVNPDGCCVRFRVGTAMRGLAAAACALALVTAALAEEPRAQREPPRPLQEKGKGEAKKDDKVEARRQPKVYNVEEARAVLVRGQVRTYVMEEIKGKIYLAVRESDGKKNGVKAAKGQSGPEVVKNLGLGKGGPNPFKKKKRDLVTPDPELFEEGAGKKIKRVEVSKLKGDDRLATQMQPVRMALVAAAFPFKKQIAEHRSKLSLRSDDDVLREPAQDKDKGGKPQFAFRFLGVVAERRELDAEGKPAAGDAGRWKKLDLEGDYRDYLVATGMTFEPEDRDVGGLAFPGLVMPRLPLFRSVEGYPYPSIEKALKKLADSLRNLKGKKDLPEHCLVRVVDVTVQPGRTYEYRLKVRMANPNYQRRDVASPAYAREKELESAKWSKGVVLRVEPELHYYAVNQAELAKAAKEKYSDRYTKMGRDLKPSQMMFFQAHRWVESIKTGRSTQPIGEWAVAARFPVHRGEFVGRQERVEVPRWNPALEDFVIATDSTTSARSPGVSVNFGAGPSDASPPLLVDFAYGPVRYSWTPPAARDKRPRKRMLEDESAGEAVLVSGDGKLLLRETALDAADEERIERLKAARIRIAAIKERDGPGDPKKKEKGKFFP